MTNLTKEEQLEISSKKYKYKLVMSNLSKSFDNIRIFDDQIKKEKLQQEDIQSLKGKISDDLLNERYKRCTDNIKIFCNQIDLQKKEIEELIIIRKKLTEYIGVESIKNIHKTLEEKNVEQIDNLISNLKKHNFLE